MLQSGVLRTNCIDCLDRTNVAQVRAACVRVFQCSYLSVVARLFLSVISDWPPLMCRCDPGSWRKLREAGSA